MIPRPALAAFLRSIPGLEGWADSQEHLEGCRRLVEALGEPTEAMCSAGEYDDNGPPGDNRYITDRDAEEVWHRMFAARFGEGQE